MSSAATRFLRELDRYGMCREANSAEARRCTDAMYTLFTKLVEELAHQLGLNEVREAERRGLWTVEALDNAVEKIVDAYYDVSSLFLDCWDSLWELYTLKNPPPTEVARLYSKMRDLAVRISSATPRKRSRHRGRGRNRRAGRFYR